MYLLLPAFMLIVAVFFELLTRHYLRKYRARGCTGRAWRREFPTASKNDIRAFLNLIVGAFGFSRKLRLYFSPNDKIMDLYACANPVEGLPDGSELETLIAEIEHRYNINLESVFTEHLTVGELFALTHPRHS